MTQDDIIRMAREAGFAVLLQSETVDGKGGIYVEDENILFKVMRFAELFQQYMRHDGIHTCHDQCQRPACVATRNAVEREREACAELAFNAKTYLEAAAPRQWVGLTDEEIIEVLHPLVLADLSDEQTDYEIARAIEAKLREKNVGLS